MGFFDKEFPEANFSVAAFLETHHKNEDDSPDLIREYIITHHCIHTPTPHDHKHSGIIILISKNYDILHPEIKMPMEDTTSFVWKQIHLNMYTTYSYNKYI